MSDATSNSCRDALTAACGRTVRLGRQLVGRVEYWTAATHCWVHSETNDAGDVEHVARRIYVHIMPNPPVPVVVAAGEALLKVINDSEEGRTFPPPGEAPIRV